MLRTSRRELPRLAALVGACLVGSALLTVSSCGGDGGSSPTGPSAPTPPPTPPTPPAPPAAFSLTGRVVNSMTGQPIAGARIAPEVGSPVTTGPDGGFSFSSQTNPAFTPYKAVVSAEGYLTRNAYVTWARERSGVQIDLIPAGPPFSIDFYRQFVRNTFDAPEGLEPLRRWTESPSVYVRTVDQDGREIDSLTLNLVIDTIRRSVPLFTGGTLRVVRVETGTETRARTAGWINVELVDDPTARICGQSYLGANPGLITLIYNLCGCNPIRVRPSTVAHEVGHAMGFWHVREDQHIMASGRQKECPVSDPTPEEQLHARIAYTRAPGNKDPDDDVNSGALARPGGTVGPAMSPVTCFFPTP